MLTFEIIKLFIHRFLERALGRPLRIVVRRMALPGPQEGVELIALPRSPPAPRPRRRV